MSRRVLSLNGGDWRLGQAPDGASVDEARWREIERVGEWVPAIVPGNVRADLIRSGRLPDLALGMNSEASSWVDNHCWWFVREFDLPARHSGRRILVLRGVDYVWELFLNGECLGSHEGMFSPQRYDITPLLRDRNTLAVRITGSEWLPQDRSGLLEKALNRIEGRLGGLPGRYPDRRDTLKCQVCFGWDFAPALRTMGIWDDVFIMLSGRSCIQEVVSTQEIQPDAVLLSVRVQVDGPPTADLRLRCTLAGDTFPCEPVVAELAIEQTTSTPWHELHLRVEDPRLWWPWDLGQPDLYRLSVELLDGGQVVDCTMHALGLREIAFDNWTLRVNGHRLFARGANWVPAHILPGCTRRSDYAELLSLARRANMNMLRVWGGGLREKQDFYDLCDRLGILVWQDLPFACAFVTRFPRSDAYLRLVETETRGIVRDLREHPSLFLWCGGNEFSPKRNVPLISTLLKVVTEEDPGRPFLPVSPSGGDSHNWRVWHQFHPPAAYRHDSARFASEFGLQAPPAVSSLRSFIPDQDLWPPGPSWEHHGADLRKLWRYALPFLTQENPTLAGFVEASQRAQACGLQMGLEHYRRRKAQGCGGALVWQFNEPWPAISWSLLASDRKPKPAFEMVRRCLSPVLVTIRYPLRRYRAGQRLDAEVWVINDLRESVTDCTLEVALWDADGEQAEHSLSRLDLPSDSAFAHQSISWLLPQGESWRLICRLVRAGAILSENAYDLAYHDGLQPTLAQRTRAWLAGLVTAG